jgi:hypothetical protein
MKMNYIRINLFFFTFLSSFLLEKIESNDSRDVYSKDKNTESLRFLDENEIILNCEFPFTCGNSYITSKKICNDIYKTLKKRKNNIVEKLSPKNISTNKRDFSKDEFFNIFLEINNRKFILATTNSNSQFFNSNLINYPIKFISGFGVPSDKDFTQKFNLIEFLENGIFNFK